jgi:cytochrome c
MINKKVLLSITAISLLFTGCNEKETTQDNTPILEKKSKIIVKKVEPKKIVEVSAPIIKTVLQVTITPDGKALYKKCAGCHGLNAEKKALGKSEIIQNWEASQISEALKGYKNGTYGGAMKGLMKSQVANLTEKNIDALSKYILTLK